MSREIDRSIFTQSCKFVHHIAQTHGSRLLFALHILIMRMYKNLIAADERVSGPQS
jgi:hypothetical protein